MTALFKQQQDSREDKRQQKRMAVLQAAAALFNKNGYDRTSIDDIAAALNVTKRTLYYYVKGKEEILFECNRQAMIMMEEPMRWVQDASLPLMERIMILMRGYMDLVSTDFGACLALAEEHGLSEESKTELRGGRRNLDHALRDLIREGIKNGEIVDCNPVYASAMLFGAFNQVPRWFHSDGADNHLDLADHYLAFMLDGLKTR